MARKRHPRWFSTREYAAHIGKSKDWVLGMLRDGRIPEAQRTGLGWIIPENAQLIVRHANIELPPELAFEVRPREMPKYKPRKVDTMPSNVSVEVPGYQQAVEGMTVREIVRKTGVHHHTLKRIKEGKSVKPLIVHKLASGLGVSIETLLRRP